MRGVMGTLLLVLTANAMLMAEEPAKNNKQVYKRVADRSLELIITKPKDWQRSDERPAIVFFHGGGWVGGKPGQFDEHSTYLADRGMVAVQVEYRLLNRAAKNTPPDTCVEDARDALAWVREHAEELGIDTNRIATAGGSAGGHLAAYLGTVDAPDDDDHEVSTKSNAMVLFNPVYDNGPDGWGYQRTGERYQEFSPMHNISQDDPPHIVFLGTKDNLIPVATAERFQQKMQEAGVKSELRLYEGQPHGFFNHGRDENRWYNATIEETDKFLTSLGWLPEK